MNRTMMPGFRVKAILIFTAALSSDQANEADEQDKRR